MIATTLLFYHLLRGNPCHSVKDIHIDKVTVVNKLTVKVGWYYNQRGAITNLVARSTS